MNHPLNIDEDYSTNIPGALMNFFCSKLLAENGQQIAGSVREISQLLSNSSVKPIFRGKSFNECCAVR